MSCAVNWLKHYSGLKYVLLYNFWSYLYEKLFYILLRHLYSHLFVHLFVEKVFTLDEITIIRQKHKVVINK